MKQRYLLGLVIATSLTLVGCSGGGGDTPTPTATTQTVPTMTVAAASVIEGNAGTAALDFTVTLSETLTDAVTVDYYTADGTATAGSDYTAIPVTSVVIPAGSTTATATVTVMGDTLYEADETITLHVSSSSHTSLGSANVVGTITNDDTAPIATIAMASVVEGNAGITNLDFTVSLDAYSSFATTLDYVTSDGTATSGSDYAVSTGTLTIPAGATTGTITVDVYADTLFEPDETLTMTLSNPSNATLGKTTATGSITNDDTAPTVSIAAATVAEGNAGTTNLDFTVTLDAASSFVTTVDYVTADGTAIAGTDYTAASGTLTIPAGATTGTITVVVTGDPLFEADESLNVTLSNPTNASLSIASASGSITNDDVAPIISIASASVVEGNAGTANLNFTVSLNAASGLASLVDYATSDGTAVAGTDYTAGTGTLNIPAGSTTATITVLVTGETVLERDETLNVVLSNPINATVNTALATGTILDDDVPPVTMTSSGRSLDFAWSAGSFIGILPANIDHYRILVNPDGVSGFTVIPTASNITTLSHSLEIPVHRTNWASAQYLVEACNLGETVCDASANLTLSQADSIAAIVYAKASNTEIGDAFGYAVALSGDGNTLAVGAIQEDSYATGINGAQADNSSATSGAVYIFVKSGNVWSQQAYVKASNAGAFDQFGYAISLSNDGSTLAVSALLEDSAATGINGNQADNAAVDSGAVYVFSRTGTIWSQQAYIKASNAETLDYFGVSLSISGDGNMLVVGASLEDSAATGKNGNQADNTAVRSGAVYVFNRTGTIWTQQTYLKASNTDAQDRFGFAVALSSDSYTLAVGAFFEASAATFINGNEADNTAAQSGAVYVFNRVGVVWAQQAYIKASNAGAGDAFGISVALSGDGNTLAVGATGEDSQGRTIPSGNAQSNSGAVYVFSRVITAWSEQSYIKPNTAWSDAQFGGALSLSADGNLLAIGSIREPGGAKGINGVSPVYLGQAGAAFTFGRTASIWSQQAYVKASNTASGHNFGNSVTLSGDGNTLAVGAIYERSAATGIGGNQADISAGNSGAVYLY